MKIFHDTAHASRFFVWLAITAAFFGAVYLGPLIDKQTVKILCNIGLGVFVVFIIWALTYPRSKSGADDWGYF
jgi:hypothetical protein